MKTHTLARLLHDEEGQNIVEFALLLPLLMYILMGIIQFGFIFAAYLTLNNAVREGARWGSTYVYDGSSNINLNDGARNNGIVDRIIQSRGILAMAARGSATNNFSTASNGNLTPASCPEQTPVPVSGFWYGANGTNPDLTICYSIPTGVSANDARRGYYLDVQAWYHQLVFIPLLDQFLPNDPVKGAQWIRLPARITVVVN
ncbi:MAG TPA: TadE/TadG family type IV pilus assembly protein [Candidatus Limnocylindria bacterium]|nr:TadE/TadG family type IV pilus assembly protein [Candidatus Limnocylindria bacterium]